MGNTKRTKGELRRIAQSAMRRMKSGYWKTAKTDREDAKNTAVKEGKNPDVVDSYYRSKFSAELLVKAIPDEDPMYARVRDLLESDEDVSNPIARLIEKDKYDALDNTGKQRYIMTLSAKYRELSDRYYSEKARGG
jgi:hypothetical protein